MQPAPVATLGSLQDYLANLYELDLAFRVEDFLISDERLAQSLEGEAYHPTPEKLLIRETSSDEVACSLFMNAEVLARLDAGTPLSNLSMAQLEDFWTALEGVSHFLYLAWNVHHDRGIRGVELELQAEVDKYVVTTHLAAAQRAGGLPDIHALLFEHTHLLPGLSAALGQRYRDASRSAAIYCRSLARRFSVLPHPDLVRELRRFYRLDHSAKLRFIEQH
ncbi:MAG: hypothetical protein WBR29_05010 [Gammaproteobacteria bacterium]